MYVAKCVLLAIHNYYDETEVARHDIIVQNGAAHLTGIVTVRI